MADVIVVKDLIKKYNGRTPVLDGVSFSVVEGEFVSIFGKSGCGKTTLLNILGGLDRPSEGEVLVAGEAIASMGEDQLARFRLHNVGFVFQDYNLLQDLTVRENIALPARFSDRKTEEGRVDGLLRMFDIIGIADETANKISGGEAQRTAIARAMMNEPKIILADEPTGNLDKENAANVMDMFHLVRRDFGTTVILATHDSELAMHSTKRITLAGGSATTESQH
jgi:ABC-type lipoprotein export system ATPase subunit